MIGYVTVGTNDLARAQTFFDAVFGEIGAKRSWNNERMTGWSMGPRQPSIVAAKPHDEKHATFGNGTMIAITTTSPADVDKVYAKAIAMGGKDEGAPGFRSDNFYGAYFR